MVRPTKKNHAGSCGARLSFACAFFYISIQIRIIYIFTFFFVCTRCVAGACAPRAVITRPPLLSTKIKAMWRGKIIKTIFVYHAIEHTTSSPSSYETCAGPALGARPFPTPFGRIYGSLGWRMCTFLYDARTHVDLVAFPRALPCQRLSFFSLSLPLSLSVVTSRSYHVHSSARRCTPSTSSSSSYPTATRVLFKIHSFLFIFVPLSLLSHCAPAVRAVRHRSVERHFTSKPRSRLSHAPSLACVLTLARSMALYALVARSFARSPCLYPPTPLPPSPPSRTLSFSVIHSAGHL